MMTLPLATHHTRSAAVLILAEAVARHASAILLILVRTTGSHASAVLILPHGAAHALPSGPALSAELFTALALGSAVMMVPAFVLTPLATAATLVLVVV